jgi:two-component system sensor histidine kinase/response regulator
LWINFLSSSSVKTKEGDILYENINTAKEKRTILIIDDDQPMLMGLRVLLERSGYQVIVCNNSPSGITMAEESHPDLIVCDIMMPIMDGFKVRDEISANPFTKNIPFLFLSARASQTDKLRGLEGGADDYVTKPFDPRELVARINAVFRRQDQNHQDALKDMNLQIERIQNEISHNISHELRTPMTQILMSLDMVLRNKYDDPEELKWFVETALSQSHRLNALIDDLTFLSNYDMERMFILRQKIDIENDFRSVIAMRHELYRDKSIRIEIHVAEEISIHAPRREFKQAISHLVDNSMKFSPPMSYVLIDLAANGNGGCIFTVTDYGPGIPIELHEKVFERYYQISQGDTREFGGLGVGLTIARTIARSLDGDVGILPTQRGFRVEMVLPPAPLDMP